jgi:TPR repeat protein
MDDNTDYLITEFDEPKLYYLINIITIHNARNLMRSTQIDPIYAMTIGANHGNVGCMFVLGQYYYHIQDETNMIKYFTMASDNNCFEATQILSQHYLLNKDILNVIKYNEILYHNTSDLKIAYMIGLACEEHVRSFHEIELYDKMIKYYDIAAINGNADASIRLAYYYYFDANDESQYIKYLSIASDHKNKDAAYLLGLHYEKNQDMENAKKYYTMAVDYGDLRAKDKLKQYQCCSCLIL